MSDSDSPSDEDGEQQTGRQSKVSRVIDRYNLTNTGEELEKLWTADSEKRMSLRELADHLNKQIIESALSNAGVETLPGEIESIYSALRGDETSVGVQKEVRGRLDRTGVGSATLEKDLVSYQSIRTYLIQERGVEYETDAGDPRQSALEQIQRLRGRLRAVTEQRIDTMVDSGELSLGDYNLLVDVQVYCEDCGRQYSIDELFEGDGCDCNS